METNKVNIRLAASLVLGTCLILAAASIACRGGTNAADKPPAKATATSVSAAPTKAAASTTPAASATSAAAAPSSVAPDVQGSATAAVAAPVVTSEPVIRTPALAPTEAPPPPPPPSSNQSVSIAGVNSTFSVTSLSLPAGATVTITFDNQDAGVTHDIEVYDPSGSVIAASELADGPIMQTVVFTLGGPGNYSFKCSVHPQQMRGFIKVQ